MRTNREFFKMAAAWFFFFCKNFKTFKTFNILLHRVFLSLQVQDKWKYLFFHKGVFFSLLFSREMGALCVCVLFSVLYLIKNNKVFGLLCWCCDAWCSILQSNNAWCMHDFFFYYWNKPCVNLFHQKMTDWNHDQMTMDYFAIYCF